MPRQRNRYNNPVRDQNHFTHQKSELVVPKRPLEQLLHRQGPVQHDPETHAEFTRRGGLSRSHSALVITSFAHGDVDCFSTNKCSPCQHPMRVFTHGARWAPIITSPLAYVAKLGERIFVGSAPVNAHHRSTFQCWIEIAEIATPRFRAPPRVRLADVSARRGCDGGH